MIAAALRRALPAIGIAVLVLVVLVAPNLRRIHDFWVSNGGTSAGNFGGVTGTSLANLAGPLRAAEGLQIWPISDFRLVPGDVLQTGVLVGFALVVLAYALVSYLERRQYVWPGAILAFGLIYLYARHSQSPYVAAKALTIPGPLLVAGSGGALLRWLQRRPWPAWGATAVAVAAVAFFVFAFQSSYLALRNAFVGPSNHTAELRSLRKYLHGRQTVALFYDDFIQWELLGQQVSSPLIAGPITVGFSPQKPWSFGDPIDFDSLDAATLDRFAYAITTSSDAQSQPPPNFRLVAASPSYRVWQRVGPTPPHNLLAESTGFGAALDCRTAAGLRIAQQRGTARVRGAPRYFKLAPLFPGGSEQVPLQLPPGDWDVSIPFTSAQAVTVRGAGLDVRLPPNLDRVGEIWPVGRIRSTGSPVTLTLRMDDPGWFGSTSQFFTPQPLIAVPPGPDQQVRLRSACGRFVDWYVP